MGDYLMREAAPLSAEIWAKIDEMVVTVVSKNLVGRRFLPLVGPLGWGVEQAPLFGFEEAEGAAVAKEAVYIPLQELREEFLLKTKHLAMASATPFALDLGAVAIAATKLAKAEDAFILSSLMQAATCSAPLGDWDTLGGPFAAVAAATAKMLQEGYDGPYALVVSPAMYARLASLMSAGRREIEMVEKLVKLGVFQATGLPEDRALVLSPQAWNMDLVVGQDVVTAYLGNEGLDQRFRIFETLALRVKRAGAICVLK
ncbi:MAG: encapsulin [Chloroflexi bacterium]|nr:encapsulin [Chloroflexota bacterium]